MKQLPKKTVMRINDFLDQLHRPFHNGAARLFSMLLALGLSVILLINPNHIAESSAQLDHGYLTILMIALSAVFVHGSGFKPRFWLWKVVFSPYLSWAILLHFIVLMFT